MTFTQNELNLIRQWFGCVQDIAHQEYLETEDYKLAKKIHEAMSIKVPHSVSIKLTTK